MIIVDEVDYLLSDFKTIETLRDLHDETGIPIVLVGMSLAKHKLKKHTHLFDRISEIYQYTGFEYSDIKQIVDEISEVDMTKEVISAIHQKAKSFRKIVEVLKSNCFCRAYIAPFILGSSPILTKTPFVSFLSQLFFVYLDNSCLEKPCCSSHLVVTKALCGTFSINNFKFVSLSKPMVYILAQK